MSSPPAVPKRGPPPPVPANKPAEDSTQGLGDKAEAGEDGAAFAQEEVLEIENAVEYEGECVGPDQYRHYILHVDGDEDTDIAVFDISLTLQEGSANVFVNRPSRNDFPLKDDGKFDWNVKRGQLVGSPGTYRVSVYGVPSFIDNDIGGFLTRSDANWSKYSMYFEWRLMTPDELAARKAVEDKFASRKESIFDSSFGDEMREKLAEERAALDAEQAELEARLEEQEAQRGQVDLSGTAAEEKYEIGGKIGTGDFSIIRSGKSKASGGEVALKVFSKSVLAEMHIDAAAATQLAQSAKPDEGSSGAVEIIEILDLDEALVVVMPRYNSDLIAHVSACASYAESDARALARAILEAVASVHKAEVLHRSIAPNHILVADGGARVALSGWCFAEKGTEDDVANTGGDPAFQPPEVHNNEPSGRAADMWSAGAVIFLLLTGKLPFEDTNSLRLFSKISTGKYEFPAWVPETAQDLVKALLVVDKTARLSATAALEHAWFSSSSNTVLVDVPKSIKTALD